MGVIIPELSLSLERILVVTPTQAELKKLFEELSLEMTTELSPNKAVRFHSSIIPSGAAFHLFSAFNLGQRGDTTLRLMLLGVHMEEGPIAPAIWELCDSAILSIDPTSLYSEEYLRSKLSPKTRDLPCLILGMNNAEPTKQDLRYLAIKRWIQANFTKYHISLAPKKILTESLEWSLSF